MEPFAFWLVFSVVVAAIWRERGRSFVVGLIFSVVFSPLVGLLVGVILKPDLRPKRWCIACRKFSRVASTQCKYCSGNLESVPARSGFPLLKSENALIFAVLCIAMGAATFYFWESRAGDRPRVSHGSILLPSETAKKIPGCENIHREGASTRAALSGPTPLPKTALLSRQWKVNGPNGVSELKENTRVRVRSIRGDSVQISHELGTATVPRGAINPEFDEK